jgi:predicted amidohydrolase
MEPDSPTDSNLIDCKVSRRGLLGAVGAAAGVLALSRKALAAPEVDPKCLVRIAVVSYSPPFHDHYGKGIDLSALRDMTAQVAKDRPDFICYPEICTCGAGGFDKGLAVAPELEPYAAEVGKLAREFNTAIVAPFIERKGDLRFNSVPIVNRQGELVLTYRKNYPTTGEMEAGITPGSEVPVANCDGINVGAAVCFDLNFDQVAAELERQKAQLVFWPSMYWGGQLLQHWASRYGFVLAASFSLESSIVDMNGKYLARQGTDTYQVRRGDLPPWAVADINTNRDLFHLDFNRDKFKAMRAKHGPDIQIELMEPEGYFLLSSRRSDLRISDLASEFSLETLRDYLARSVKMREERLPA